MTCQEFNEQFDVLYNNIMSDQAPGLDEYEKGVFLTKAQEELIRAYFAPQGNKYAEGFDSSGKRQIDFSPLLKTEEINLTAGGRFYRASGVKTINLPEDLLIPINEAVDVMRKNVTVTLNVIPLSFAEYSLKMSQPFKRPLKNQAWRIITQNKNSELIAGYNDSINKYIIRYLRKPKPIILAGNATQTCELDESLHQEVLQRAVELAKAAYTADLNGQVSLGLYSETEKGIIPQYNRYR